VNEIGSGDQTLRVTVDGREVASVDLPGGRRYLAGDERWVAVPLDAGPREIRVENGRPGADWIGIRRYCFAVETERASDLVDLRGLHSDTHGFLYLRNQTAGSLYRDVLGRPPVLLTELRVRVNGLTPGHYDISVLDTQTGIARDSLAAESTDGTLDVELAELRHDAALRFSRRP